MPNILGQQCLLRCQPTDMLERRTHTNQVRFNQVRVGCCLAAFAALRTGASGTASALKTSKEPRRRNNISSSSKQQQQRRCRRRRRRCCRCRCSNPKNSGVCACRACENFTTFADTLRIYL